MFGCSMLDHLLPEELVTAILLSETSWSHDQSFERLPQPHLIYLMIAPHFEDRYADVSGGLWERVVLYRLQRVS